MFMAWKAKRPKVVRTDRRTQKQQLDMGPCMGGSHCKLQKEQALYGALVCHRAPYNPCFCNLSFKAHKA